jgi:hypothetical protein
LGHIDDLINDGVSIVPDIGEQHNRAVPAMLLAIHILCWPFIKKEMINREDCLSLGKLQEEGTLAENLVILGWKINMQLLTITLPEKKVKQA